MPWRDILIANGFVSLLFGLAALFVASTYSAGAHRWVQESSVEEFARVVRLAVLVYILSALIMLGAGLIWLVVIAYSGRRVSVMPPTAAPEAEP